MDVEGEFFFSQISFPFAKERGNLVREFFDRLVTAVYKNRQLMRRGEKKAGNLYTVGLCFSKVCKFREKVD